MTPTKKVVLITTTQAAAPIVENRFIGFDGKQAKAGAAVLGVTPYEAVPGDDVAVECIGIVLVEAGGAIAAGDAVASDAQGCAVKGTTATVGIAASTAQTGELVAVLLK